MYQIAIAATSSTFSIEHVEKVKQFLEELAQRCGLDNVVLFLGGYWGLMKVIVDYALKLGFKVVLILPIEREDVELPNNVIKIYTGTDYKIRSGILVRCGDVLVCLGGESGTIIEIFMAYGIGKNVYILDNTGFTSDKICRYFNSTLDSRQLAKVYCNANPKELAKRICEDVKYIRKTFIHVG